MVAELVVLVVLVLMRGTVPFDTLIIQNGLQAALLCGVGVFNMQPVAV